MIIDESPPWRPPLGRRDHHWDLTLKQDSARGTEMACLYISSHSTAVSLRAHSLKPKFTGTLLCFQGNTYLICQIQNYTESVFLATPAILFMCPGGEPPCSWKEGVSRSRADRPKGGSVYGISFMLWDCAWLLSTSWFIEISSL